MKYKSVTSYLDALAWLHKRQHRLNMNSSPNPRRGAVRLLLSMFSKLQHAKTKQFSLDTGAGEHLMMVGAVFTVGSIYDGFGNTRQIDKFFEYFFLKHKASSKDKPGVALRDAMLSSIGMHGLLRASNWTLIRLCDLGCYTFHDDQGKMPGSTPPTVYFATAREGKENQHGKFQYAAFMRNKTLFRCPQYPSSPSIFSGAITTRGMGFRRCQPVPVGTRYTFPVTRTSHQKKLAIRACCLPSLPPSSTLV